MTGFGTGESASRRVISDLTGARKEGSNEAGGLYALRGFCYTPRSTTDPVLTLTQGPPARSRRRVG